ncbi:MAG TPA: cytochrome c-type biogenesis protein [Candidatus Binataceae bacterium]|nr:cytochrome c-type biogenesis protein [Candidatus Binataceae bacterium]
MKPGKPLTLVAALLAISLGVAAVSLAASIAAKTSVQDVSEGLTCQCGCGLTVANCNHPQCEFAVPVRTRIEGMIANGMSRPQIIAWFRTQYGEKVLSAPTTEGFNLVAWIMPFAALIAGGLAIFFAFGSWRSKAAVAPVAVGAFDPELKRRLEQELRERI